MAKELISVINKVPVTVFLWRPEKYWPAEFVSENIKKFGYTVEEFTSGKVMKVIKIHKFDLRYTILTLKYINLYCNHLGVIS